MARVKSTKPKKRTKTMKRGLRLFSVPSLDNNFPQRTIQKMEQVIEDILSNNQVLDEISSWIITQAILAAKFRQASIIEKNTVMIVIQKHRKKGHRLGFSERQMQAINRIVLQKDQTGQLEDFAQRLFKKRKE
ncbi:hypothetical protein LCGC14_0257140 [marine sediment metagenome]|uniref:Uncharacterized protein n=1 Tax=marine sediment metagenome TaxID=412755 RepID=A0A0F9U7R2_9ZZZZ